MKLENYEEMWELYWCIIYDLRGFPDLNNALCQLH